MGQDARPNFLLVVVDDMGYSDISPFGGELETPHLEKLAARGARFRGFHTSSLCAPTRSMLLSGCDNHQAGLGVMQPKHTRNQYLQPGYEGYLNTRVPTIAEVLSAAGYHTFMAGKWHLGIGDDTRPAARGFERSFAFLGGGVSHFSDAIPLSDNESQQTLYRDDDRIVTHELPEDFYSSTYYVDRMIEYLDEVDDDRPFFGYLAFTAPHDPIQLPDSWLDRRRGRYDAGYDAIRDSRIARMRELGLVSSDTEAHPGSGHFPTWDELTDEQRAAEARDMEIYTGMIELVDHELGRLLDHLESTGRLDDTIVVFMSDNGANPLDPGHYAGNSDEQIERDFDNSMENRGRRGSFVAMGGAWAEVADSPLSHFKATTYEGGIQTPLIVAGGPVTRSGVVTDELLHVADLYPTFLDFAGVARPAEWNGERPPALYGRTLRPMLTEATSLPVRGETDALCFEMTESKCVLSGRWKALHATAPWGPGEWQLFDLHEDPREMVDVAGDHPEVLEHLSAQWDLYAAQVGYIEAEGPPIIDEIGAERFFTFMPVDVDQ